MKNTYKFFANTSCEYFPCHKLPQQGNFNCLFCYCPLYAMDEDCGGIFTHIDSGVKCCSQCHLPHLPEYYDIIIHKLGKIACPPQTHPPKPNAD